MFCLTTVIRAHWAVGGVWVRPTWHSDLDDLEVHLWDDALIEIAVWYLDALQEDRDVSLYVQMRKALNLPSKSLMLKANICVAISDVQQDSAFSVLPKNLKPLI